MPDHDQPSVVDDRDHNRFVVEHDGLVAELTYRRAGDRLTLVHTGVPEELGGRGIGGRLVRAAVEHAARDGLTVAPRCPYARKWLEDHPDVAGTVTVDWSRPSR